MIVSFNQPVFIPWGGFFCRLLASSQMVLLDDTLLAQGFTFVNRNRLKGKDGETWITVPLKKKGRGRQRIKDLEVYGKEYWGKKFCTTLQHLYGKSIYFAGIYEPLARIIRQPGDSFLRMIVQILDLLEDACGITTPVVLQSSLDLDSGLKGSRLLLEIARKLGADEVLFPYPAAAMVDLQVFTSQGIQVKFLKFQALVYPQFHGNFVPCLSILDLLFSLGSAGRQLLEKSYTLTQGKVGE